MKNKHRIKQGLSLLLAGGIALTNLGAALPAFAEDAAATPETAQTATLDPDAGRPAGCTCRVLHRQRGASGCDRADKNQPVAVEGRSVGAGQPS